MAAIALLVAALVAGRFAVAPAPVSAPRDWQTKESCGMWSDTVRRGANLRANRPNEADGLQEQSLPAAPVEDGTSLTDEDPCTRK